MLHERRYRRGIDTARQENPRVDILNPLDDTIDESLDTELNPLKVVFTQSAAEEEDDDDDEDGGGSSSGCFIKTLK